jgi:hypothetical protein
MYTWTDQDTGTEYEMNYVVGQSPNERDYVEWRIKGLMTWQELPPFAMPPDEAMELWHGLPSKEDGGVYDNLVDLLSATARLTEDMKRLGIVNEHFESS